MSDEDSPTSPEDVNNLTEILQRQMSLQDSRHKNMHIEAERLKTLVNWNIEYIDKSELAMLGLYFLRAPDVVKCAFCDVQLRYWKSDEEVLLKHFTSSDNCPLLTLQANNNIPLHPEKLDRALLNVFYPDLIEQVTSSNSEGIPVETSILAQATEKQPSQSLVVCAYPQFEMDDDRIVTFNNWPSNSKKKPDELCEAGFFYTGAQDEVTCFSCGGSIEGWTEEDNIWEIHVSRFSNCSYVEFVKGAEFSRDIKEKYGQGVSDFSNRVSTSNSNTADQTTNQASSVERPSTSSTRDVPDRICKVCYDKEYDTVLDPCRHVIVCKICAPNLERCPLCRKPIRSVTELIFT